jgi:hypothetical protein
MCMSVASTAVHVGPHAPHASSRTLCVHMAARRFALLVMSFRIAFLPLTCMPGKVYFVVEVGVIYARDNLMAAVTNGFDLVHSYRDHSSSCILAKHMHVCTTGWTI